MSATLTAPPLAEKLTAAQVYGLLEEQHQGSHDAAVERRFAERSPWFTHVTVTITADVDREARTVDTIALDTSRSSIGIVWRERTKPGTAIAVRFESLPQRPTLTGTVCHCTHIGGTHYHVGIQFINTL